MEIIKLLKELINENNIYLVKTIEFNNEKILLFDLGIISNNLNTDEFFHNENSFSLYSNLNKTNFVIVKKEIYEKIYKDFNNKIFYLLDKNKIFIEKETDLISRIRNLENIEECKILSLRNIDKFFKSNIIQNLLINILNNTIHIQKMVLDNKISIINKEKNYIYNNEKLKNLNNEYINEVIDSFNYLPYVDIKEINLNEEEIEYIRLFNLNIDNFNEYIFRYCKTYLNILNSISAHEILMHENDFYIMYFIYSFHKII